MNHRILIAALVASLSFACGDDEDDTNPTTAGIEVAGTWTSSFGGDVVITDTTWTDMVAQKVVKFDNTKNSVITLTPATVPEGYTPNVFSRTLWTETVAGVTNVCTVDFNLATQAEAEASTTTANANDLDKGCGGFGWTKLTKK